MIMEGNMKYFEIILLVLVLSFGFVSFSRGAPSCGIIDKMSGKVEVHRLKETSTQAGGTVRDAVLVMKVPFVLLCNDVVVTGPSSAAKLKLPQSVVSLSSNSRISLGDQTGGPRKGNFLELSFGKVRTFFQKNETEKTKEDQVQFRVKSPAAVTGVRGTDFFVSYDPNVGIGNQATLKGTIEVQSVETKEKVMVKQGEQVTIDSNLTSQAKPLSQPKLEVKPIAPSVAEEVRQASVLAKEEKVFQSVEAVNLIGPPDTWKSLDLTQVPEDLKSIKNEF